jgi:lysophospholipase L1-like esterase
MKTASRMREFAILLVFAISASFCQAATRISSPGRSFMMLKKEHKLTIGYFGGSITEGAGASNPDKTCWRALTTAWFREQYPQAQITEVNAAIGGTGSDLGAFRIEQDLLSKHPDLVFVEFAVNDGGADPVRAARSMEGIIRHIWRSNPKTDIIFVYTTTESLAQAYDKGEIPAAIQTEQKIADYYGIPTINMGYALWKKLHDTGADWKTLTIDTVHPNDEGYRIYTDVLINYLKLHQSDKPAKPHIRLPAPMTHNPFENGKLVDAWSADAPGWLKETESLTGRYPHRLSSNTPGSALTYDFEGSVIGLYWLMGPDSGDIEWSIDSGETHRASSWDIFALQYNRANYAILADNLAPGKHQLHIKVLSEKNNQSKGTWIRIGAFLVQ